MSRSTRFAALRRHAIVALMWVTAAGLGGCDSCTIGISPPATGGGSSSGAGGSSGSGGGAGSAGTTTGGGGGGATTPVANGAVLALEVVTQTAAALVVSVDYTADPAVDAVGIQLDVDFDAAVFGAPTVVAGAAAPGSGVQSNTAAGPGKVRLAALDLGLAAIASGSLAEITLPFVGAAPSSPTSGPATSTTLVLSAVTAGDANGTPIPVTTVDLSVGL